jgi:shikimate dehydrogenase
VNIILTGMRGTGKSSIGALLADRLAYAFVDTDVAIEALAGYPIAKIVDCHGWDHFRALERQVVAQIAAADHQVVAAGGGTLIDPANAARLKARGTVILLESDIALLQRRIGQGHNRPSLTGQNSPVDELMQVWQTRKPHYYAAADLFYNVSNESDDITKDLHDKAAALHLLLIQQGFLKSGHAS